MRKITIQSEGVTSRLSVDDVDISDVVTGYTLSHDAACAPELVVNVVSQFDAGMDVASVRAFYGKLKVRKLVFEDGSELEFK